MLWVLVFRLSPCVSCMSLDGWECVIENQSFLTSHLRGSARFPVINTHRHTVWVQNIKTKSLIRAASIQWLHQGALKDDPKPVFLCDTIIQKCMSVWLLSDLAGVLCLGHSQCHNAYSSCSSCLLPECLDQLGRFAGTTFGVFHWHQKSPTHGLPDLIVC